MRKVKLFTHTDLDGVGNAILAQYAFGKDNVDIEYCDYENINKSIESYLTTNLSYASKIYITDISVCDDLAKKINDDYIRSNKIQNIKLLDHHATALKLNKYDWCKVKVMNEQTKIATCGTELFYNELKQKGYVKDTDILKQFVNIVRDYDTWNWSKLGESGLISKYLNEVFYIRGKDNFVNWCLSTIIDERFPIIEENDKKIIDENAQKLNELIKNKNAQMTNYYMGKYRCGYIPLEDDNVKFSNELGNKISLAHPELDFVVMVYPTSGLCSFRTTKENIDLGKDVASVFGGGGHPKAAGAKIPIKEINNIKEQISHSKTDDLFFAAIIKYMDNTFLNSYLAQDNLEYPNQLDINSYEQNNSRILKKSTNIATPLMREKNKNEKSVDEI